MLADKESAWILNYPVCHLRIRNFKMLSFWEKGKVLPPQFLFSIFLHLLSYRKVWKVQCCELFWSWKRTILFCLFVCSPLPWSLLSFWYSRAISVEGLGVWIIVWLLALNLCQNAADCQVSVTASEMLLSLSCYNWHNRKKHRGRSGDVGRTSFATDISCFDSRALPLTLHCSINLMSTLGSSETACLWARKAESLNLNAAGDFSVSELRGVWWDLEGASSRSVCFWQTAVTGISQPELFTRSPSSWKWREEKEDPHHLITIATESTVHSVIIQSTDIKIKHSDRQYYPESPERLDI